MFIFISYHSLSPITFTFCHFRNGKPEFKEYNVNGLDFTEVLPSPYLANL